MKKWWYALWVPMVILAVGAFFQLRQLADECEAAAEQAYHGMIESIYNDIREIVFNESRAMDICWNELLEKFAADTRINAPIGCFIWRTKGMVDFAEGIPEDILASLKTMKMMRDWGDGTDSKHIALSGLRTIGNHQIMWVRDGKRNGKVCGVVFVGDPLATNLLPLMVRPIGTVLIGFFTLVIFVFGWRLVEAVDNAKAENRMRMSFLSNVSHELKTQLTEIGLKIELLQNGIANINQEETQKLYRRLFEEKSRMIWMVDNLLAYSRLEQKRSHYTNIKVDLIELAKDVVEMLKDDFKKHGVSVHGESVEVWADMDATKQILVNLLWNASKYAAADGEVEVLVAKEEDDKVKLMVADCGPGMSEEECKRAFEWRWRSRQAKNSQVGGSGLGLGLAISKALAHDMNGRLSVEPRLGGGCVFTLELPIKHEE